MKADDMHGRRCVTTGATSGIGRATARALAEAGAELVLVARNRQRAEETQAEIVADAPDAEVTIVLADLGVQAEIREAAERILADGKPIHVLLNNAGVVRLSHTVTPDTIETTFAVNHLAYFLLTLLLLDRIRETPGARIVNVASHAHRFGSIDFHDIGHAQRFRWMRAYAQSKLANISFTYELAQRLADSDVSVNCLHPGGVATGLGRDGAPRLHRVLAPLLRLLMRSPDRGAETSIYLASSPEVAGVTGRYFADCEERESSEESRDPAVALRLWELSEHLTDMALASP